MPLHSANILTPCRLASTKNPLNISPSHVSLRWKSVAIFLAAILTLVCAADLEAQTKRKKAKKPKAVPCRAGCKPDTTAPNVLTNSAEDASTNSELSELARNLHNAGPQAYEKLSAFAAKHPSDIWGARAALALGYDDYQKNRAPQALARLTKAKDDTLLSEYVFFWAAQSKRSLRRNAEALADLKLILRDYPNTAIKE